jgi:hypothetical protein
MNFVISMAESQEHKEEDFYTDVVEDLAKIKAWQSMTDAWIRQTLPILGREFPNLWAALDYSVHQEKGTLTSSIAKLQQEMLEATKRKEEIKKQMKDWLINIVQSFENVKARFGDMAAELKMLKIAQARQSSVGSGSVADRPRIRNDVLFPMKSPNGKDAGDSDTGEPLGTETLKVVMELQKQITKLEVSRSPSNGSGGNGPPHLGGLGLTCIKDLASWNMEWGLGHYFGLFHDANSLLTFKQSEYIDAHDHVATLKRAHDVGLTLIQAKLLVTFQNQTFVLWKGDTNKDFVLKCTTQGK